MHDLLPVLQLRAEVPPRGGYADGFGSHGGAEEPDEAHRGVDSTWDSHQSLFSIIVGK